MNKHITPLALAFALSISILPAVAAANEHGGHANHTPNTAEATDSRIYTADGVIASIDVQSGTVTISHEALPALGWPKMTMRFRVDTPSLLSEVTVGDTVRFDFRNSNGTSVILDMETK